MTSSFLAASDKVLLQFAIHGLERVAKYPNLHPSQSFQPVREHSRRTRRIREVGGVGEGGGRDD
jgi:hypothetical protein